LRFSHPSSRHEWCTAFLALARSLLLAGHLSGLKARLLLGLILRAKVDRNAAVAEFTPTSKSRLPLCRDRGISGMAGVRPPPISSRE
jgi:hypothetical protein